MAKRNNLLLIFFAYLFFSILAAYVQNTLQPSVISYLIFTAIYLIGAGVMFWLSQKDTTPNPIEVKSTTTKTALLWGFLGGILAILAELIAGLVESLLNGGSPTSENTTKLLLIFQQYPFVSLYLVVAAPVMEELIFRRTIYGKLSSFTGKIGAALISSVLFALAHADGFLLIYTLIGLVFCYVYTKTGKLFTSMIAHSLMNTIVLIFSFWH